MINRVTPGGHQNPSGRTDKVSSGNNTKPENNISSSVHDNNSEAYDTFGFNGIAPETFTPNGKIPIIISGKSHISLKRLKNKLAKEFGKEQAKFTDDLPLVAGLRVEVDPKDFGQIMKTLPQSSSVVIDNKIKYPDPEQLGIKPGELEKNDRPALDIENSTLGINRLWDMGLTGKGIGICVIDSGIYPHKDFEGRIKAFADMSEGNPLPYDPYGHGTHVAGVAAGSGTEMAGKFKGVAPEADLISVRITSVAEAIKGIQWAIENKDKYNIKVLNMSLGDFPIKSYQNDPWAQAAEKAWDSGIMVVVAAGNEGPGEGTVSTPGIDPKVLTVGAFDDKNTPAREDDTLARFSSRGPTTPDGLVKPDILAPGVEIFGPLSPGSTLDTPDMPHVSDKYIAISGSSMATPLISGLTALMYQANPNLTNEDIKKILMDTADKYIPNAKPTEQGAGVVDPMEAIQVALKNPPKPQTTTQPAAPVQVAMEDVPVHFADEVVKNKKTTA
ncbi:MAG: S8 family peptidase [Firmicutes bacterium]|nr:S8 family peptidase [Bacillota bacterium]